MAHPRKLEVHMGRTPAQSFGDKQRTIERKLERQARRAAGLEMKPGPLPKPAAERIGTSLTILTTDALRADIDAAARAEWVSLGDWVRTACIEKLARG